MGQTLADVAMWWQCDEKSGRGRFSNCYIFYWLPGGDSNTRPSD